MKKRIGIPIFLAVLFIFVCQVLAGAIRIDSDEVIPNQPLNTDLITFNISGVTGYIGSHVEYSQFLQNETALQLDLYFEIPMSPVVGNWTYPLQISSLEANNYTLEVRAFRYDSGTLQDTYTTEFTVTPEPGTFVLLAIGLPIIRGFL